MRRRVIVTVLFIAMASSNPISANASDDATNARNLAAALQEHMVSTYSCQKYLGGTAHFEAAKLVAIESYAQISGDRNDAVIAINKIENELRATRVDKKMEAQFKSMKLSKVDAIGTCQQLVLESLGKIELLKAKLRLL